MNKSAAFVIGAAIGAAAAFAYGWLLGPASATSYDGDYASRLDHARAEGERVAAEREAELTAQYRVARARSVPSNEEQK